MALNVIRPSYLDASPPDSSSAAAGVVHDQLVSFIRLALRGLLIVALAVAHRRMAQLTLRSRGDHPPGHRARDRRGAIRRAKAGLHTVGFGVTLATYRGPIPTPNSALTVVITTAVLLVVLELLAHAPEPQTADSPTAGDPP